VDRTRTRNNPFSASGSLFDWHGDSIFTNFIGLYRRLRRRGYYIDVLTEPFSCFDAKEYGT
jgi:membrane-bound transcription factor site-1 protease